MIRRTWAALAASVVAVLGSSAQAGPVQRIDPEFFGGAPAVRAACQRLVATEPARLAELRQSIDASGAQIAACLQLLRASLSTPPQPAAQRQLLQTYRAIQLLAPWVKRIAGQPDASSLATERLSLDADARAALSAHGLLGANYSAVLQGGAGTTPTQGTVVAVALIDIETRHADLGAGWDGALGFQFGRRPLLAMTKAARDAAIVPADTGGLITAETMRFARTSGPAETAIVGRIGATRLDARPTNVQNDVSDWTLLFDACVDIRWYDRDVWLTHLATQPLDPLVHAWLGVRHDQRFHRAGDLSEFDDPTARIVAGVMVNPIRSGDTRLIFGGGFEFESAMRGPTRLPSGFRVLLSGNLDLRRAAPRGHVEKAE